MKLDKQEDWYIRDESDDNQLIVKIVYVYNYIHIVRYHENRNDTIRWNDMIIWCKKDKGSPQDKSMLATIVGYGDCLGCGLGACCNFLGSSVCVYKSIYLEIYM